MRNYFIVLCLLIIGGPVVAQDYEKADSTALTYPKRFKTTANLAQRIAKDFSNDHEKVRALYTWLAANVSYDGKEFGRYNYAYSSEADRQEKEKLYSEKIASYVTSRGKAVCQGYAFTFKVICEKLNIKADIISGDGKGYIQNIGRKYTSDHVWNWVELDGIKYLLDVTWASKKERVKGKNEVEYMFFLQNPKDFIKAHYPDDYTQSLLKKEITKQDYADGPVYFSYDTKLISSQKGIIYKRGLKDQVFQFDGVKQAVEVYYLVGTKTLKVEHVTFKNGILEFKIPAKQIKRTRELVVFFNEEAIVGFKVK